MKKIIYGIFAVAALACAVPLNAQAAAPSCSGRAEFSVRADCR